MSQDGEVERKKEKEKTACRQVKDVNFLGSSFEDKAVPWGLW